jgi:trans-aconitate methyltransferase
VQKDFGRYIGVDISEIAIESAKKRNQTGCEWYCADIADFNPECKIDVILFRQSLYYLTRSEIKEALKRYRQTLTSLGVIIVVMNNPKRHQWITDIITCNFKMIERNDKDAVILVFK